MALFKKREKRSAQEQTVEQRSAEEFSSSSTAFASLFGTGTAITEEKVMKISTAKACVDLITNTVAGMPVYLYKENENGSIEKVNDKRVYLLNHENQYGASAINFKKGMVKDYVLHGHAFANIGKTIETVDDDGEVLEEINELNHLPARNIQVEVFHDGIKHTSAEYTQTTLVGTPTNQNRKQATFTPDDLLVVVNTPDNPFQGKSVLEQSQKTFQQALDEMDYNSNILQRGALPLGILKTEGRLNKTAVDRLRNSWSALYGGVKNSAKTVILEEGMNYQALSLNPQEMQMNESRKNTNSEICKLFGVPESMITTAANKYGSIEQNQLHFLKHTLASIINSFEATFDRQLLTEQEKREGYYFRFDTSELLRATEKEKVEAVALGLEKGLFTINEARTKLDLPAIDEDVFMWGLQNVLYNPATKQMKVPNMGLTGQEQTPKGDDANGTT